MIFANHWVARKIAETYPNQALVSSSSWLLIFNDFCLWYLLIDPLCQGERNLNKRTMIVSYQSVDNAGVAVVKGSNERNEFFEKVNRQLCMTNKSVRKRKRTNNLRDELIWG